jgi:hypothetical protein
MRSTRNLLLSLGSNIFAVESAEKLVKELFADIRSHGGQL